MLSISQIRKQVTDEEKQIGEQHCFVVHDFQDEDLREKLQRALNRLPNEKLQPYFANSEVTGEFLLEKICKKILTTRATIVDLSSAKPNVYFELGLALGLNKPIFVVLRQHSEVPSLLENFFQVRFTSYTELEENLVAQLPAWLEQSTEYNLRYNDHCHFVNLLCPHRQRITPQRRYFLIDDLKISNQTNQFSYDQDLEKGLLIALERFHFEPTLPYKIPIENKFQLCDYCCSLRDNNFALCHLTHYSSLNTYLLLGLVTGLDIPSLLIVQKKLYDAQRLFEIPSILNGLNNFEYENYKEISEQFGNVAERFLNAAMYKPIIGRVLNVPEPLHRERRKEQKDQVQRELPETAQMEVPIDLERQLLAIRSIINPQEQQQALDHLVLELADQGEVAKLWEIFPLTRSFTHSSQVEVLTALVRALVRVRDTEGIRRVVEVILIEERDEIRDPVLQAIAAAYTELGEQEMANEIAFLRSEKIHKASSESQRGAFQESEKPNPTIVQPTNQAELGEQEKANEVTSLSEKVHKASGESQRGAFQESEKPNPTIVQPTNQRKKSNNFSSSISYFSSGEVKVFLLGLPGSGKSSVARFIRTYVGDRGWMSDHLDYYRILRRMYKDDIEGKQFKPAAHDGFDVLDLSVFDKALEILADGIQKYNTQEQKMLLIEFSRNDYRHTFRYFNQSFLQDAYFLYLNTNIDICKERIRQRIINPTTEDDYFVSDHIFNAYYHQDDGLSILDILASDLKVEYSRIKIINNNGPLQETAMEIIPFVDHITPSYQLAHRY